MTMKSRRGVLSRTPSRTRAQPDAGNEVLPERAGAEPARRARSVGALTEEPGHCPRPSRARSGRVEVRPQRPALRKAPVVERAYAHPVDEPGIFDAGRLE